MIHYYRVFQNASIANKLINFPPPCTHVIIILKIIYKKITGNLIKRKRISYYKIIYIYINYNTYVIDLALEKDLILDFQVIIN